MMMIPHELDEGRGLVFQSAGNPSRFSNDRILGIFVKIGVEDPLVHEVGLALDGEEHPSQRVELQDIENIGRLSDSFLEVAGIYSYKFSSWPGLTAAMIVKP